jgi:dienelactone hydrolase
MHASWSKSMLPFLGALFLLQVSLIGQAHASGQPVEYRVGEEPFEGYFIPASGVASAPLVLLVHDWDGLNDYEIRRAQMLSAVGYSVFAVDLFGKDQRPDTVPERVAATRALYDDRERMRALLQGALAAAEAQGAPLDRTVAMGYCFGGAVVLELARSGAPLQGFVSFHGGLATPDGQSHAQTQGSVLILHGTADASISMQEFAQLAAELEQHGIPHEMITYSGAPHAFTVFGSDRYREEADRKSWARFLEYLRETF